MFLQTFPWPQSHHRECDPAHPVDLVKSPQMSVAAVATGFGCGQDTVAPPTDVPKSDG